MPAINLEHLIYYTFLKEAEADSQHFRVQNLHAILEKDAELPRDPEHFQFFCKLNGDSAVEIDCIEHNSLDIEIDTEQTYWFCCINAHQAQL
jgi:hypothetical protein